MTKPNLTQIEEFLRLLYGDDASGHLAIWNKFNKKTCWKSAHDIAGAAKEIADLAQRTDCYFGIGLQPEPLGPSNRGKAETVCAIPGLWFDLDVKGPAHKEEKLPRDVNEALAFLGELPLPPTAVVQSGNGLQVWWLFERLWTFETESDRKRAGDLSRAWQQLILLRCREHGWKADNTSDLARVLRPVGTLNYKGVEKGFHDEPRLVSLHHLDAERRYIPESFEEFATKQEKAQQGRSADDRTKTKPQRAYRDRSGEAPQITAIVEGCEWMRHCRDGAEILPEPGWFAMLGILGRCENGHELAHEWSSAYPEYDPVKTDKKLEHVLKDGRPMTCSTIREKAGGEAYCATCPHWNEIKSPISLGSNWLHELLETYVYVVGMKRFLDLKTFKFLDKEQLNDLWLHRGGKSPANKALRSRKLRKVDNITFSPGQPLLIEEEGERRVNLWREGGVERVEGGDISPFLEHLEYLIPDQKERDHVLNFFAFLVQQPGEKIHHALLIQGKQGTGKSFLAAAMERLLGLSNVVSVDTSELKGDYTGWMKHAQAIVIEEMMARGRIELMNKLKPLITQPYLRINEKYVPQYRIPNRANFLLFSNYEDAIILDEGDRRYFVCHSPARPQETAYYHCLFAWLDRNAGVLLDYLLTRDLSEFQPKARAPMTASKEKVIATSQSNLETYLRSKFEAEEWPFTGDLAVPSHLQDVLPREYRANIHKITAVLEKLGGKRLGQKRMRDGSKPTVWAMRRQKLWEQASERKIAETYGKLVIETGGEKKVQSPGFF